MYNKLINMAMVKKRDIRWLVVAENNHSDNKKAYEKEVLSRQI